MKRFAIGSAAALLAVAGCSPQTDGNSPQEKSVTAQRSQFGTLADGTPIEAVTLTNDRGVSARIIAYGATLQALEAPDRDGKSADIMLGYDDLASFVDKPNYFGVTVGRYANRIAGGKFALDGQTYQLTLNDTANSLHGGARGFDKQVWTITDVKQGPVASVTLALTSPDGDQGYPGTLTATVTYALDEKNQLTIDFNATTDRPTVVNMTNHGIFNLAGEGAATGILDHKLTVPAAAYTPVNAALIPTGELKPVAGTVFDFRKARTIGDGIRDGTDPQIVAGRGYDHNFALDAGLTAEPKLAARLEDPKSGRVLDVLSTEPGMQIYTGNFLDGTLVGKHGHLYRQGDGIAMEPQKFPDSPNQPGFASARVDPGTPYHHRMIFRLSTAN
ncbi:aldose epimerase family protein [Hephaestia sp. GCM10023244]|uniref:aldose epimerase family protein n=1 Tax=unclassified Hephaestia TaxID=2631281 RepID=UPI0020772A62|nr:aldose epimerase family protein [Hephaestia sp. MAHUQ-44]MCM8730633.1 galactose mutarotase [Hephaestia sp. MAHUQ-44]